MISKGRVCLCEKESIEATYVGQLMIRATQVDSTVTVIYVVLCLQGGSVFAFFLNLQHLSLITLASR